MAASTPPPPDPAPAPAPDALDDRIGDWAAGDATADDAALLAALSAADPSIASRLAAAERLEATLRSESLLPVPLGLVSDVLARIAADSAEARSADAAASVTDMRPVVGSLAPRSRLRWASMAALALAALGAGVAGLSSAMSAESLAHYLPTTVASSGSEGPVASLASLVTAARETTSGPVRSLSSVSERMPGHPAALGAGAVVLFGAAFLGARRRGPGRPTGRRSLAERA